MFKILSIITLSFGALTPCVAYEKCSEVSLISFDIELYAPESEATIESRAQQVLYAPNSLSNNIFWAAYKPLSDTEYDSKNVRAIIKSGKGNIYIDRFGWVRAGDKYGKIDEWAFENDLLSSCPA